MMLASGKFVWIWYRDHSKYATFCGHINGDDFKDPGECDTTGDLALISSFTTSLTPVAGDARW